MGKSVAIEQELATKSKFQSASVLKPKVQDDTGRSFNKGSLNYFRFPVLILKKLLY